METLKSNLLRYNSKNTYCFYDLETTSLNLYLAQPFQYSCVIFTKDKKLEERNIFIDHPNFRMGKEAAIITKFNEKEYRSKAISAQEALKIIMRDINDSTFVGGHNVLRYDNEVLKNFALRNGFDFPRDLASKTIDTVPLIKGVKIGDEIKDGDDLTSYQFRLSNMAIKKRGFSTLSAAAEHFGVKFDASLAHDALYDVNKNVEIFLEMIKQIQI